MKNTGKIIVELKDEAFSFIRNYLEEENAPLPRISSATSYIDKAGFKHRVGISYIPSIRTVFLSPRDVENTALKVSSFAQDFSDEAFRVTVGNCLVTEFSNYIIDYSAKTYRTLEKIRQKASIAKAKQQYGEFAYWLLLSMTIGARIEGSSFFVGLEYYKEKGFPHLVIAEESLREESLRNARANAITFVKDPKVSLPQKMSFVNIVTAPEIQSKKELLKLKQNLYAMDDSLRKDLEKVRALNNEEFRKIAITIK